MRPIVLISAGFGSVGVLTGTGMAINHFYGGESIRAYIEKTKRSSNKVFLTTTGLDLLDIKAKYEASDLSKRPKPKDVKGQPINKEKLVEWCNNNVDNKFSSKDDPIYLAILSWCFVNPKTIAQEMDSKGRQLYSNEGNTSEEWQHAWTNYSKNKTDSSTIKVESTNKLNENDKVEGGKALHTWCNSMKSSQKKLYEDGEEANYELFDQWCTKDKG